MKKLFIILLAFSAAACSKVSNHNIQPPSPEPFFKNPDEVTVLVKSTIQKLGLEGELKAIDRVSYLHSGTSEYAFIFYSSTKGAKSMVAKKGVQTDLVDDGGVSVTVCKDGSCDCKVKAIIYNDGTIDVGCSCTSCKMVTTTYASLEIPGDN